MKNALKGVLLSALVLPGLGQFVLKRRLRGTLVMLAFLALLGIMTIQAINKALAIVGNMTIEAGQVDVNGITDAVRQATTGSDTLLSVLVLVGWLVVSVDAYLLGKKLDHQEQEPTKVV
ncbi:MAG: hypothetical protein KKD73_09390 [Proteobacteria bacterium]|nr:hypothetical protein [Pseudomonadota bacterium]MBU1641660.1 hypothetical protein [Pseudomonadota bacterium]